MSHALPEPSAEEHGHSATLARFIHNAIATDGAIPFSRFMELCLYAPGLGYYSAGKTKFGAAGDFITAPELGALFARCIAGNLAPALRELGPQAQFVELGGGSGVFARDALLELARLDALPQRYAILEPSADLRQRQHDCVHAALPADIAARVEWIEGPPEAPWRGVLFANEVIDALPATRFVMRGGQVFEEYVNSVDGRFVIEHRPADSFVAHAVRHVERDLEAPIDDGYRSEILPQLPYWMQAVIGTLESGLALFCDYGYTRREFYLPERSDGTLMCHYRHRAHDDALFLPGLQDITASVDFTALAEAGNSAGFGVAGYTSQARFLLAGGLPEQFAAASADADTADGYRLAQEVKRLTLPGEMGERFQLMLFARAIDAGVLPGAFNDGDQRHRL